MRCSEDNNERYSLINKTLNLNGNELVDYYESIKDRKYIQLGDTNVVMKSEELKLSLLDVIREERVELFKRIDLLDELNVDIEDGKYIQLGDRDIVMKTKELFKKLDLLDDLNIDIKDDLGMDDRF